MCYGGPKNSSLSRVCFTYNRMLPQWWIHSGGECCWRPTSKVCVKLVREGNNLRISPCGEKDLPMKGLSSNGRRLWGTQYHQQGVRSLLVILNCGSEYQRSSVGERKEKMVAVVWRYSHTGAWNVVLHYLRERDMREDQTSWSRST